MATHYQQYTNLIYGFKPSVQGLITGVKLFYWMVSIYTYLLIFYILGIVPVMNNIPVTNNILHVITLVLFLMICDL